MVGDFNDFGMLIRSLCRCVVISMFKELVYRYTEISFSVIPLSLYTAPQHCHTDKKSHKYTGNRTYMKTLQEIVT